MVRLSGGVGAEPFLGNRLPAADGTAVRAVVQPLQGPVDGGVGSRNRDGTALAMSSAVRVCAGSAGSAAVGRPFLPRARLGLRLPEQSLHLAALGRQAGPGLIFVHASPSC